MCDNVISAVRFTLLKLVKFSILFFSYLLLVFITPVNKDYHILRTAVDVDPAKRSTLRFAGSTQRFILSWAET